MIIIWQFSSVKSFCKNFCHKGKKNKQKNKAKQNKPKNNNVNIVDYCIDIIFATSLKTERSYWKVYYVYLKSECKCFTGVSTHEKTDESPRPLGFFISSSHNLHSVAFCYFRNMDELAEDESCRFRPPRSVQEEDSLLGQSKPKSTQYKDKWAVEVFRTWQAAREQKFCILDAGSVFKDYDVHRVQSLEEKLEDLDSLSLRLLAHKIRPRSC